MKKRLASLLVTSLIVSSWNTQTVSAAIASQDNTEQEIGTDLETDLLCATASQEEKEVTLLIELNQPSLLQQYNNKNRDYSNYYEEDSNQNYNSFLDSEIGVSQRNAIYEQQSSTIQDIATVTGVEDGVEVIRQYSDIANMIVVNVKAEDITKIEQLESVKSISPSITYSRPDGDTADTDIGTGRDLIYGNDLTYQGDGMLVAVVDTGCQTDHEAFTQSVKNPKYNSEQIANLISEKDFVAETYRYNPISALSSGYISEKIPFAYDYCDSDYDVNPTQDSVECGNDHGNHVAGIIGSNSDTMKGIAPQTQLAIMKVFPDTDDGAPDYVILDALTDCVCLEVDVINMSLGRACGYTEDDTDIRDDIYEEIQASGINLVVAAGNEGNSAQGSTYKGSSLSSNPDVGTVGSPSTVSEAISVASYENSVRQIPVLKLSDGTEIQYFEDAVIATQMFTSLIGQSSIPYVCVENYGEDEDYKGLDVTGKIAVVIRGGISYTEKMRNAQNHGAIGIIFYENQAGTIYSSITVASYLIPAVIISKEDGEIMQLLENKTLSVENNFVSNSSANQMSSFSSWGCTPDLKLKPEITGVGGKIYSTLPYNGYGSMSGTSMAAPQIAGASALIKQYLYNGSVFGTMNTPLQAEKLVNNLMMSTTTLVKTTGCKQDGTSISIPYSPRRQGSGLANIQAALETQCYLYSSTENSSRPVMNLGDNISKDGIYTAKFHIVNASDQNMTYVLNPYVMTETPLVVTDGQYAGKYIAGKPTLLDAITSIEVPGTECAVSGEQVIFGPSTQTVITSGYGISGSRIILYPGKDIMVIFHIKLTDTDKAYINDNFENGEFVEGFLNLEAVDGTSIDMNIPFLGFYGDWSQAPILEANLYDIADDSNTILPSIKSYYSEKYTGLVGIMTQNGIDSFGYLGKNQFGNSLVASKDYIALSPNDDGFFDSFYWMYYALRNTKEAICEIKTEEGNVLYHVSDLYNCKSYDGDPCYSFIDWAGTDEDGNVLANDTKVYFEMQAYIDCGDCQGTQYSFVRLPIVIDTKAPVIKSIILHEDTSTLTVTVQDNQYISSVYLDGTSDSQSVQPDLDQVNQAGTECTVEFTYDSEKTDYELIVYDYALNKLSQEFTIVNGIVSTPTPTPTVTTTPTPTSTPTTGPVITSVPVPQPVVIPIVITSPTPTPTVTPTPTPTPTPTVEPLPEETVGNHVISYDLDNAPATYVGAANIKSRLSEKKNLIVEFKKDDVLSYAWCFMAEDYNASSKLPNVKTGISIKSGTDSAYKNGIEIEFAQKGAIRMEAKVKLNVSDSFKDCKVYLYKKSSTGKLLCVPNSTYMVDSNGYVELNIVAGGNYVLLSKAAARKNKVGVLNQVSVTSDITCKAGESKTLKVQLPATLTKVTYMKQFNSDISQASYGAVITYRTSDSSIATVTKNGVVKAKKAGTATIRVIIKLSNGMTKSYKTSVTVK